MKTVIALALILSACTDPQTKPTSTVTRWRASLVLGALSCQASNPADYFSCQSDYVYKVCPGGDSGSCLEKVDDLELLDYCIASTEPDVVNVKCAGIYSK